VDAARLAEIDPCLLAATAARESGFKADAYRREPGLDYVQWRSAPDQPLEKYFDGSIGPCQVLRSNFRAFGVDNEQQAYDLATNYRVGALIIRGNLAAFPGDQSTAVSAYNVGEQGARNGAVPANDYTETILGWITEYQPIFGGAGSPETPSDGTNDLANQIIQYGETLFNTPYVFGGKFLARDGGLDCSGFVCEALEAFGVRLGDRQFLSAEAIRQLATPVSNDQARPGDLVFFQNTYPTPGASHIGFWIGTGQMLDTHQPGGVQITDIHTPYWQQHWLEMRRVLPS
jgi:cell wall-associated NlpC family hydrolase